MMRHSISILTVSIAIALAALAGCSSNSSGPEYGTMNVRMTDAPGDFDQVNLVVTEVSAHLAGGEELFTSEDDTTDSGDWTVLSEGPATYDLISLQNGVFVTIGSEKLLAGRYTQIRLKLGAGSTVVVDGQTHPLEVPSGMQSGYKLVGTFDVPADGVLDIALDFDAQRSVIQNGAGDYHLKPTVKVLPFSTAGSITGFVLPAGAPTRVLALQGADTLGSTQAAADGRFTLSVLAAGIYDVGFRPESGYRDTTLFGVSVSPQQTTEVDTVQLTSQ
jgi:hypothetical protein